MGRHALCRGFLDSRRCLRRHRLKVNAKDIGQEIHTVADPSIVEAVAEAGAGMVPGGDANGLKPADCLGKCVHRHHIVSVSYTHLTLPTKA